MFQWFKTLRSFESIAPLIRAVFNSLFKIRQFIIITLIFNTGFAVVFNMLYIKHLEEQSGNDLIDSMAQHENTLDIEQQSTFLRSWQSVMQFSQLGDVDMNAFENTIYKPVAELCQGLNVIFNLLIGLNLLIAILSEGQNETMARQIEHKYEEKLQFVNEVFIIQSYYYILVAIIAAFISCFGCFGLYFQQVLNQLNEFVFSQKQEGVNFYIIKDKEVEEKDHIIKDTEVEERVAE